MSEATLGRPKSDLFDLVFPLVSIFIVVAVVGYGLYLAHDFWLAADVGAQEANPNKHQGWALLLMMLLTVIFTVICACVVFQDKAPEKYFRWVPWWHVFSAQVGTLSICIGGFLFICASSYYLLFPPVLGTQQVFYRITETGQLLRAGQVVPTDVRRIVSKSLPIESVHDYTFNANPSAGFTTETVVHVQVRLRWGTALAHFLHEKYDTLPYYHLRWNDDAPEEGFGTPATITSVVMAYLTPSVNQLDEEIEREPTPISDASLLVRLRQAVESRKGQLPAWIESITVTSVEIPSWRQSHVS